MTTKQPKAKPSKPIVKRNRLPNGGFEVTPAVQERRRRISALIIKKVPVAEIARMEKLSPPTIKKDIDHLDKQWSEDHLTEYPLLKARELEGVDDMEREAIRLFELALKPITKVDKYGQPYELIDYDLAAKWWDKRLDAKKRRAKMLGFDMTTPIEINFNEDNRTVSVTIQDSDGKAVDYEEWLREALIPGSGGSAENGSGKVVDANGKKVKGLQPPSPLHRSPNPPIPAYPLVSTLVR